APLRGCGRGGTEDPRRDVGRRRRAACGREHGRGLAAHPDGLPAGEARETMSFASPFVLVALLAVPLAVVAYVVFNRTRARYAERFTNPAMLPNVVDRSPGWRRHVPIALLLLGLTVMLVGAARPRALVNVKRENATIVLAIDTSRSMEAVDVRPSRLAAVKTAALKFVRELPAKYRVGVVDFSTQASVSAPATRNRGLVEKALDQLTPAGGTALGD